MKNYFKTIFIYIIYCSIIFGLTFIFKKLNFTNLTYDQVLLYTTIFGIIRFRIEKGEPFL